LAKNIHSNISNTSTITPKPERKMEEIFKGFRQRAP
jgi:hypothetical protein